ncbi:MAG: RidA family protein [Candidatus Eremiobacteraeota bacterium]|nr:RidA family protein [Candidatus Eremiobacteraeota bacterium]
MPEITRINPGPRMSQAVVHAGTVYTAGHVAAGGGDVATQTREILAKLEATLAKAGSDKTAILSATVWLTDMATFDQMNAVWDAWVAPGQPPARACVGAALAAPQYTVEIAVIAAVR